MKRFGKNVLAIALTFAMTLNTGVLAFAQEYVPFAVADEAVSIVVDETAAETEMLAETAVSESAPVSIVNTDVNEGEQNQIEINQGLSIHTGVNDGNETYMNDFVAKKKTAIMMKIPNSDDMDEAKAKETVKNYKLSVKAVTNGQEADNEELSANGDNFNVKQAYTRDNDVAAGWYAVANFPTGPDKGTYNFHMFDGENEISKNEGVNFYETQTLNILVVPVNAYWGEIGSGGDWTFPEDAKPASNTAYKCSEQTYVGLDGSEKAWSNLIGELKTYLLDVYPVADINFEEGNEIDASDSSYDMINADGQKKLWEEACKLQTKDKDSGKDKYDLILAFVAYRQDKGGGQGFTYGKPTNIITYKDKDMFPTVAHEIAHCYKVGDEYKGGSLYLSSNGDAVNLPPNGYDGRDYASGDPIAETNPTSGANDYWKNPAQYKETVTDAAKKAKIDDSGAGTIVYGSLHPYSLSREEFISWAKTGEGEGEKLFPTMSYMGSNYTGNYGYYFTSSVIWDHLYKSFLVKEKKEAPEQSNGEESQSIKTNADVFIDSVKYANANNISLSANTISDEDIYYDDDYRFGESRMVEVSGWLVYDESNNASIEMDPMFSYDGDLEFMDFEEIKDKSNVFTFAAIDDAGKIMTAADGEPATTEFDGATFIPANIKSVDFKERSFSFDAAYPEGTCDLVIVKGSVAANATIDSKTAIWSAKEKGIFLGYDENAKLVQPKDLSKTIYGELLYADVNLNDVTVEWETGYEDDSEDELDTYTEIFYYPQGDDGEGYYVASSEDEDWEEGFFSMSTEGFDNVTNNAYLWIKVTSGVNACDIFSDELEVSVTNSELVLSGSGVKKTSTKTPEGTKVSYSAEYTGSAIAPNVSVKAYNPETGKYNVNLVKDQDYKVSYENNVNAGTAKVIVEGMGVYTGRNTVEFTINKKKFAGTPDIIPDMEYYGDGKAEVEKLEKEVIKRLAITDNKNNKLEYNKDFTVKYTYGEKTSISLNAVLPNPLTESAEITVSYYGKGNYETHVDAKKKNGLNKVVKFNIHKLSEDVHSISSCEIILSGSAKYNATTKRYEAQYTGKPIKASVKKVSVNGVALKSSEYKIVYSNNVEIGKARITIVGKTNKGKGYVGSKSFTYDIVPKEVTSLSIQNVKNQSYTGNKLSDNSLPIIVKAGGITLREGIDYTVKVSGNTVDVTTSQIKKSKDAITGVPRVFVTLINDDESKKSSQRPLVKFSQQTIKKNKDFGEKTFNIVPAKLNSTATTTITLSDNKISTNNVVWDYPYVNGKISGNERSVSANMYKAPVERTADGKVKLKGYSFEIKGTADFIYVTADVKKAIAVSAMGKTLDLNDPNYEIKISKTKAATLDNKGNLKGGIGTITIRYKGADKKYTGTRTVKFRYTKTNNN